MKRRNFIKITAAGSSALAISGMASCQNKQAPPSKTKTRTVKPFVLDEITIPELQAGMESGKYSSRSICKMYLQRIKDIDQSGPELNSVIELNPDALLIADQLDNERKQGKRRSPLHGIPVMIKDNIDTADKMQTTAGSLALAGSIAQEDSFVARKLREAGAVIIAKTNLSEWANFRSTHSTSGWSGRGGQTKNPYALNRNPCGSSSGSGVAVSANLCPVAIGTETDGSIVCPSSANGIVGIKPTVGLIGRSGIIPISHTQDTAGPMARTVTDAALLLGVLTGTDSRDMVTRGSVGKSYTDYTRFLDKNGLQGKRIGVARNHLGYHPGVDKLMETAIVLMKQSGAEIVDPADLETRGQYGAEEYEVLLYEFKDGLNKYLANLPENIAVRSLEDLIRFNKDHADTEMPYFGQEILIAAQEKGGLDSPAYQKALKKMKTLAGKKGIDATLQKFSLDAIVAPTGAPAWFTDWVNGDHFMGGSSSPAACAGYPSITIPAGFVRGLPVGISFFASAWQEPLLIKLAYAFEQSTLHRKPPRYLTEVQYS